MTLQELIQQLTELQQELGPNEDPEVRLAIQPQWAFAHRIDQVVFPEAPRVVTRDEYEAMDEVAQDRCDRDADDGLVVYQEECEPMPERFIYIGEGGQVEYLPGDASRALGWR